MLSICLNNFVLLCPGVIQHSDNLKIQVPIEYVNLNHFTSQFIQSPYLTLIEHNVSEYQGKKFSRAK